VTILRDEKEPVNVVLQWVGTLRLSLSTKDLPPRYRYKPLIW